MEGIYLCVAFMTQGSESAPSKLQFQLLIQAWPDFFSRMHTHPRNQDSQNPKLKRKMLAFDESDDDRINQCIKNLTVKRYLTINAFGEVKLIPPPPSKRVWTVTTANKWDGGLKVLQKTTVVPRCPFARHCFPCSPELNAAGQAAAC